MVLTSTKANVHPSYNGYSFYSCTVHPHTIPKFLWVSLSSILFIMREVEYSRKVTFENESNEMYTTTTISFSFQYDPWFSSHYTSSSLFPLRSINRLIHSSFFFFFFEDYLFITKSIIKNSFSILESYDLLPVFLTG